MLGRELDQDDTQAEPNFSLDYLRDRNSFEDVHQTFLHRRKLREPEIDFGRVDDEGQSSQLHGAKARFCIAVGEDVGRGRRADASCTMKYPRSASSTKRRNVLLLTKSVRQAFLVKTEVAEDDRLPSQYIVQRALEEPGIVVRVCHC